MIVRRIKGLKDNEPMEIMIAPNIFKTRNNWNVITLRCKKRHNSNGSFIRIVVNEVEKEMGIKAFDDMEYRGREYVLTRQLISVMLWNHSKMTEREIGKIFGKDHATISHSKKTINNLYDTDSRFREQFDRIDNRIKQFKR